MSSADITLTPQAADHFRAILAQHPQAIGIRVDVVLAKGCAPLRYVLEVAHTQTAEEYTIPAHGLQIVVHPERIAWLRGTELDYVQQGLNGQVQFNNPNVDLACGCGASFTLKEGLAS